MKRGQWLVSGILLLLVACSSPSTVTPPGNPAPTTAIGSFGAVPVPVPSNVGVQFSWSVAGHQLICKLDVEGDGRPDYTVVNCNSGSRIVHVYGVQGSYTARLEVTGSDGISQQQTTVVAVTAPNEAPTIPLLSAAQGASNGLSVVFAWTVSDANADITRCQLDADSDGTLEYQGLCSGLATASVGQASTATYQQEYRYSKPGQYRASLVASDPYASTEVTIRVRAPYNRAPQIDRLTARAASATDGTVVFGVSDPDDDDLKCVLEVESIGRFTYNRCKTLSRTYRFAQTGTYRVGLEVTDGLTTTRSTTLLSFDSSPLPIPPALPVRINGFAGQDFSCYLDPQGQPLCWGQGDDGEMGNGQTNASNLAPTPLTLPSGTTFQTLALGNGGSHAVCAVGSDWKTYCWGRNVNGLLGVGDNNDRSQPTAVQPGAIPAGVVLVQLSVSGTHACGLASNNQVFCWGSNSHGQLGNATTNNSNLPVEVAMGELPGGVSYTRIAVGEAFSCALASDGWAYCWGDNSSGLVGVGSVTGDETTPRKVAMGDAPGGISLGQITLGINHACVLGSNRMIYCWGIGGEGQIGDGNTSNRDQPTEVVAGDADGNQDFTVVHAGGKHTCALDDQNLVYCWGSGGDYELGLVNTDNHASPQEVNMAVARDLTFSGFFVGNAHSCVWGRDGSEIESIYCWGRNEYGQVGNPDYPGYFDAYGAVAATKNLAHWTNSPVLVALPSLPVSGYVPFRTLSSGADHVCALTPVGKAYCWGLGSLGALGHGGTWNSSIPTATSMPTGSGFSTFTQMSAGNNHTCGQGDNGVTYCWGFNAYSQLGNGTTTQQDLPSPVTLPSGDGFSHFIQLASGSNYACALGNNKIAYCWGGNGFGQLGTGDYTDHNTPTKVSMPTGVLFTQISAGFYTVCALGDDDITYCWGSGGSGQIGNGGSSGTGAPAAVTMPTGVVFTRISAGTDSVCALGNDTRLYCWGENDHGQLGMGVSDTTDRNVPTEVPMPVVSGLTRFLQVETRYFQTCALGNNNKLYCWGWNDTGQLGVGDTTDRKVPVEVPLPVEVGLSKFVQVSVTGNKATCALGDNLKAYCWGYNLFGKLGNSTSNDSSDPTAVIMPTP